MKQGGSEERSDAIESDQGWLLGPSIEREAQLNKGNEIAVIYGSIFQPRSRKF